MKNLCRPFAGLLSGMLLVATTAAAQGSFTLLHSLFDPGTNAQTYAGQGYTVAVDGNIAVTGAPYDDVSGGDSGVVKVYNATTGALLHTLTNPSASPEDFFGSSIAISGTRVVVGGPPAEPSYFRPGVAYVYDVAGATPTLPLLTLTNPSPAAAGRFGSAVALSGARLVVGAFGDDTGAVDAGRAYVYELDSATPMLPVLTLPNPTPEAGDAFGRSVAISGGRVVVGAYGDDTGAEDAGSAYVYDVSSLTPDVPLVTLTNPAPAGFDQFALSVSISGARVVVGTRYDDTAGNEAGSAYVYDLDSVTPAVPVATLTNPTPAANDNFGFSVAISGTRVVVGALGDNSGALAAGSAYIYDLSNATPTAPVVTLTNPSPAAGDYFGFAVAISGTRVVIGAPWDDTLATDAGSAYAYDMAGATPTVPLATLNRPSAVPKDLFGLSVGVSGTRIAVGAPYDDDRAQNVGRAYVYDLASATPRNPLVTLTNPNPAAYDSFGYIVAISGTRVLVGAPFDDTGGDNAGSVYVYDLASPSPTAPVATLNNPGRPRDAWFGWAVAISGTRVVVGAPYDDTGAGDAGTAYVYELASATPTVPMTTLTNPTPAVGDSFGWAVAISGMRVVVGAIFDKTGTTNAGSAYVYDLASPTPPVPLAALSNPSPAVNDQFGSAVAISGTRVAVGASGDDTAALDAGSVYMYELASATPTVPVVTLTNPSQAGNQHFGFSVGISGTRVVVGVDQDSTGASQAGRAEVYELTSATPTVPIATLTNPSPAVDDKFGNSVAIDGVTIVASAPFDDTSATDRGAAYVFAVGPILRIVPAARGVATISWTPASSPGFILQYGDSLASTNWVNAPSGALTPVAVSATNTARFYRLFKP